MRRIKKGFTLTELLVVMSIIGILMTISLVGIKASREKSKVAKAKSDVSNIALAITSMYADTRLYPGGYTEMKLLNPMMAIDNKRAGLVSGGSACSAGAAPSYVDVSAGFVGNDPFNYLEQGNGMWDAVGNSISSHTVASCFPNWNGPYYKGSAIDPWGHKYYIDYDYISPSPNVNNLIVAVFSAGKDNTWSSCDDIYKQLYLSSRAIPDRYVRPACQNYNGNID